MHILAFSDLHGDASTLKLLKDSIKNENFDYMLIAGDLTNADLISPDEAVLQVTEIFSILEDFKIPYYFVWGTPNREGILESITQLMETTSDFEIIEKGNVIVFQRKIGKHIKQLSMSKSALQKSKEINSVVSSLNFGKHLKGTEPIKIGDYWLTANPGKVSKGTIILKHHYRKIVPSALIQLDGHVHYGQQVSNYINLGFLYRDDSHGAQPMVGCYWKLFLEGSTVKAKFVNLGGKLKELKCPNHLEEGSFYVPFYYRKCPVCFEPREALKRT